MDGCRRYWVGKEEAIKCQIWSENENSWSKGNDNYINWWTKIDLVPNNMTFYLIQILWMVFQCLESSSVRNLYNRKESFRERIRKILDSMILLVQQNSNITYKLL